VKLHKLVNPLTAETVLREEIRWVGLAVDFPEVDASQADSLLDPQCVGIKMPHLAQTLPGADAYGRARVRPYSKMRLHSEVLEQSLIT
jgi:hypothetical protein